MTKVIRLVRAIAVIFGLSLMVFIWLVFDLAPPWQATRPTFQPTLIPASATTATDLTHQPSAVILALDGAGAAPLTRWMADGTMPDLAALVSRGITATLIPVTPSLTASTFAALSTGVTPATAGVLADRWLDSGAPFGRVSESEVHFPLNVEPLWQVAGRQGLRTATIGWPGADPNMPGQGTDMVTTGIVVAPAAQHAVAFSPARPWEGAPLSYSPLQEGTVAIFSPDGNRLGTLWALAVDTTDNHLPDYNEVILATEPRAEANSLRLHRNQWGTLELSHEPRTLAWFQLTAIPVSGSKPITSTLPRSSTESTFTSSVSITIYQSAVTRNWIVPAELAHQIEDHFGVIPPPPDLKALRAGWITPEGFLEMAMARERWLSKVAAYVQEARHPDLLFVRFPLIGQASRAFLLVDQAQPGTPLQATEYAEFRWAAAAATNADLRRLLLATDLSRTTVFLVAGPGLAPVHTEICLNMLLAASGYLNFAPNSSEIDPATSQAWALATEGLAHIYINEQGRDQPGVVSPADFAQTRERLLAELSALTDPEGRPILTWVGRIQELTGPEKGNGAGDIVVLARPGWAFSDCLEQSGVKRPPEMYGASGYAGAPELTGLLVVAGHHRPTIGEVRTVSPMDVASTVVTLWGLKPAQAVEGQPLWSAGRSSE